MYENVLILNFRWTISCFLRCQDGLSIGTQALWSIGLRPLADDPDLLFAPRGSQAITAAPASCKLSMAAVCKLSIAAAATLTPSATPSPALRPATLNTLPAAVP